MSCGMPAQLRRFVPGRLAELKSAHVRAPGRDAPGSSCLTRPAGHTEERRKRRIGSTKRFTWGPAR